MADEERQLVSVLEQHTKLLEELLDGVKSRVKDTMQDVAEMGISQLGRAIGIYYSLFTSLNIVSRSDLETLFKRHFRHPPVQNAVSDLEALEVEWDDFLERVQKQISGPDETHSSLIVGSQGPCEMMVKNARSGIMSTLSTNLDAELERRYQEVKDAGGRVLIVSFGSQEGALHWLDVTGCPFDMVTDEERKIYNAFGLQVSISKVWQISAMLYYAEQKAIGTVLPKKLDNVEDDPNQMGGDFILNPAGIVSFVHCSKSPQDRPTVDEILRAIKKMDSKEQAGGSA